LKKLFTSSFRLGILGGGQLGKMLTLAAAPWDIHVSCLDSSSDAPASTVCHSFVLGDLKNYDDVLKFGEALDIITIESDHANVEALKELKARGKIVHPDPEQLKIVQDKGSQRQFYADKNFPSPRFELFENKEAIQIAVKKSVWSFPFVVKTRSAGYDGKGVFMMDAMEDIEALPEASFVAEEKVKIVKELSVVAARNGKGEVVCYQTVELFPYPDAHLVDYLICPADLSEKITKEASDLGRKLIEAFQIQGLLAVELFLDENQKLWINECSPRPHNSGHHTIEGAWTSQYEQHLRGICNLPLGSPKMKMPSAMLNLLGEANASGPVRYEGLVDCLAMEGVKVHIYGKKETKAYRKMGHMTILGDDVNRLKEMIHEIKTKVKVTI
jgi:5-(carboxyamino)imidazole ribonucleotide synthase